MEGANARTVASERLHHALAAAHAAGRHGLRLIRRARQQDARRVVIQQQVGQDVAALHLRHPARALGSYAVGLQVHAHDVTALDLHHPARASAGLRFSPQALQRYNS